MLDEPLSEQQKLAFHTRGFVMPGAAADLSAQLPPREASGHLLQSPGIAPDPAVERHLDDPQTYRLCTLPGILERVASLLGPDLFLWHSRYFSRRAGDPPVPWHQDAPFWSMQPVRCVSAWLALDDVDEENGCVHAVPGSNHHPLPQVPSTGTGRFGRKADISNYDVSGAIPLAMPRGQFFLFDSWLLHRSDINPGEGARLAISMQFIPPEVKLGLDRLKRRVPNFGVQVVRGADRLGLNPVAPAPVLPQQEPQQEPQQ